MSARPNVVVLADGAAVAAETARRFVAATKDSGEIAIALAGGSTPKAAFKLLAAEHADAVDWSRVALYFGDERCYPPDHPDSNYRMTKENLIDPLAARFKKPRRVVRIEGELDPDEGARKYADALRALPSENGLPRFSLVLLGMGPDGHTASLFPGASILRAGGLVAATAEPHLGVRRISLTYATLNAARSILVSATGREKAASLSLALDGPPGAVPLRDVRPTNGQMTVLCDAPAASALPTA
jgi:6-phosphogluconolactonase